MSNSADVAPRHVSPHLKKKKLKTSINNTQWFICSQKFFSPQAFPPSLHLLRQPHRPPSTTSYYRQRYAQLHLRFSSDEPDEAASSQKQQPLCCDLLENLVFHWPYTDKHKSAPENKYYYFYPRYAINYRYPCKS
jgi:hypothetical protein